MTFVRPNVEDNFTGFGRIPDRSAQVESGGWIEVDCVSEDQPECSHRDNSIERVPKLRDLAREHFSAHEGAAS